MKVVKLTTFRIVNDDGSTLHPATEKKAEKLMGGFQDDKVLGPTSPVTDAAALRMVESVLGRFVIAPIK